MSPSPETTPEPVPAGHMAREIQQQPEVWRRLVADAAASGSQLADTAARCRRFAPRTVLFVARGSSDHAALYAKYLVEIVHGLPCGLVSPSTMTAYRARPDLRDVLMVAVSQSGESPDLVQSLQVGGESGALTVAVTNDATSPLARTATAHVDILAGPELSVAATKSFTAQQLALFLLLDLMAGGRGGDATDLPERGQLVLQQEGHVADLAQRYRFASRMVTTARGYSYATAREAALKLMETCYLSAQAFSGADLLHGPLAMIDAQLPVMTVISEGVGGAAMDPVLPRLVERGADVLCVGHPAAVRRATVGVALPDGTDERLSPLLEILPFQQLAQHLAVARGTDPDVPRGLSKITETL